MAKTVSIKTIEEKNNVVEFLKTETYPDGLSKDQKRRFKLKASAFTLLNESLCHRNPDGTLLRAIFGFESDLIKLIFDEEHKVGHPGINKMVDLIHRKYYGIPSSTIRDLTKSCDACVHFNNLTTVQEIHVNEITTKYDRFIMDCVDLRRYSHQNDGYGWILNVIDTFSKFLFSFKLQNKTAELVKESLNFLYCHFGMPKSIQADNGKEFSNILLREFHLSLNIQVVHGRPRNPRAQGQVERVNQTIKRWLAKTLENTDNKRWIDHLSEVVYKYNITKHRATNQSPFMLFYGHPGFNSSIVEPVIEEDLAHDSLDYETWDFNEIQNTSAAIENAAREHHSEYRNAMIRQANPNTTDRRFEVGDIVLLKVDFDNNTQNRRMPFNGFFEDGRYIVVELLSNNMLKIRNERTEETKNVFRSRLRNLTR